MAFRIGRKHAQHTYPESRFGAPALIQTSSDKLGDHFDIAAQEPIRIEKDAVGALLEAPLNGFRRSNGLWVEATVVFEAPEASGDMALTMLPWIEFASLPGHFIPVAPNIIGTSVLNVEVPDDPPIQTLKAFSITFNALVLLPEATGDMPPVPVPAIDDIKIGVVVTSLQAVTAVRATVMASEINRGFITQIPTMNLSQVP